MTNSYCDTLGIEVPSLAAVKGHPEARPYSLLLVALLENGEPLTLAEVAERFEEAGVATAGRALASLQRCRPARPPVHRDGERYALDPHDDELDLWAFRLGLRPPKMRSLRLVRPEPEPLPGPAERLTVAELEEAWEDANLWHWSVQRLALATLDAHGGVPMAPGAVVAFVTGLTRWHGLRPEPAKFRSRSSAVVVREDGRWEPKPGHDALAAARRTVRDQILRVRERASLRPDPAVLEANRRAAERRRAAHAAELAALSRVIVRSYPVKQPEVVVLLDVAERRLTTHAGEQLDAARERLEGYDAVAAADVRAVLRGLGVEGEGRRLHELGPPQKTRRLNKRGRILKITLPLLIQASCGIARPLGDPEKLERYRRDGQTTRLRRRLESDAKSLFAFYQYGRLHHAARLRWGFLDERLPVPWVHRDEPWLGELERTAHERSLPLEVVAGSAPGWSEPWARARRCFVEKGEYDYWLVDEEGFPVEEVEVQLARLARDSETGLSERGGSVASSREGCGAVKETMPLERALGRVIRRSLHDCCSHPLRRRVSGHLGITVNR